MGHGDVVAVPVVPPNGTTDVNVSMVAPQMQGVYQSEWKMITINGSFVGGEILPDSSESLKRGSLTCSLTCSATMPDEP